MAKVFSPLPEHIGEFQKKHSSNSIMMGVFGGGNQERVLPGSKSIFLRSNKVLFPLLYGFTTMQGKTRKKKQRCGTFFPKVAIFLLRSLGLIPRPLGALFCKRRRLWFCQAFFKSVLVCLAACGVVKKTLKICSWES